MVGYDVVARFPNTNEAYVAQSMLLSEGIDVQILNENSSQAFGILTDQIGGISLAVNREDQEKAKAVLIENGIIKVSNDDEYPFISKFGQYTDSWPLIRKVKPIYRLLFLITALLGVLLVSVSSIAEFPDDSSMKEYELHMIQIPEIESILESNPKLALSKSSTLLEQYPKEGNLWYCKGWALYYLDSLSAAYSTFENGYNLKHHSTMDHLYYMGQMKMELKEYDVAIIHFKELTERDSFYFYDLGWAYEQNGNLTKSIRAYSAILKTLVSNNSVSEYQEDYKFIAAKIDSLRNLQNE